MIEMNDELDLSNLKIPSLSNLKFKNANSIKIL